MSVYFDMKRHLSLTTITAVTIAVAACKKDHQTPPPPLVHTTVQYQLYTEQDFSTDTHPITFRLFMRTTAGNVLFDSALAPMLIKDVPNKAHMLVFRKEVPAGNETS